MALPSRTTRLLICTSIKQPTPLPFLVPWFQRRTFIFRKKSQEVPGTSVKNPLTEEFLKRKPTTAQQPPVQGSLGSSSIFADEEIAGPKPAARKDVEPTERAIARDPTIMAAALDPDPVARVRWQRRMVIREVRKRGRLSRTQALKRQEREIVSTSHNFQTSVKKLGPLARQIAGKSVEEAIVQMRFSKKKVAFEVRKHLEHARNEAIVRRGMGLGVVKELKVQPVTIKTKKGKRIKIGDPTALYVDQAWVGKGDFGKTPDYRARGQVYMMKNRTTHISLLLKEETTRLREHEEKEEKIRNRKVWVQLPNRKITSQRQYYSW